jgi:hypothetical protein
MHVVSLKRVSCAAASYFPVRNTHAAVTLATPPRADAR